MQTISTVGENFSKPVTVLVAGSREDDNARRVHMVLDDLHTAFGINYLIEGGEIGAACFASQWARSHEVPCITVPLAKLKYGNGCYPRRDLKMLSYKPDIVVAFPGTSSYMLNRAKAAPVILIEVDP